jgi:site-specific DNA recombinase
MERPALTKLLDAVRARRVGVIVVYKVDRLTRSLADFAKLVELFDEHQVSFVSVTQAFNTTTSMGRLTLNVLLSFAQFEREVTGERIRDKIAASKRKGIWMGGVVSLGYRVENRALHVVEEHAAFVRDLFRRYLEIGSVVRLKAVLDQENVRLPIRTDCGGKSVGGGPISRGHLYKILSNPIYVGRLIHKAQVHEGLHGPIVDQETWDRVQSLLAEHAQNRAGARQDSDALLAGKFFDDRGNRMSPSHATKGGRRYRYYVSQAVLQGRKEDAGSIFRVPAMEIERRVIDAVRGAATALVPERSIGRQSIQGVGRPAATIDGAASAERSNVFDFGGDVRAAVERITIRRTALKIQLAQEIAGEAPDRILLVPWTPPSPYRRREIVQGAGEQFAAVRPMRTQARVVLVDALRDAHRWLDELTTDPIRTIESIAAPEKKTERSIRMTLSLAFLSPALVKAAIDGRLPRGFGTKRLMDLPMTWSEQWSALGLKPSARP